MFKRGIKNPKDIHLKNNLSDNIKKAVPLQVWVAQRVPGS
jgi:hypothetical protein